MPPPSLPADAAAYLHEVVARGQFSNEAEAIAEALRLHRELQKKRDEFLKEIDKGLEGPGVPADVVFAEMLDFAARLEAERV